MEKNPKNRSLIMVIGVLILGAMLGSLMGEVLKMAMPDGVVKEVFLRSVNLMIGPGVVDMLMFSVTIGFSLSLNLVGILGMVGAYYVLRFWR
ncbi:DUF4321 domain-containing protein [bacterium]|nr:DUF4321 domain-containing protein [bacterium]MBU1633863.1 DUF4321 domain-containing protein [bacterium]MBU1872950.1 DUF4321 domain-containing protein [bacterium]